ncbi:MAG TPA: triose-phosphate isomerase [Phycisphaerales bacterium]|nr:triose-phosphate isomerase [Phycisphaerales bacterium]
MRTPLMAANWKMHLNRREAKTLVEDLLKAIDGTSNEVLICPPTLLFDTVQAACKGSKVATGVQNMHFADKGAFTGEVSAEMVKEAGAGYVIIGHSERRAIFGETDEMCAKKVLQADAFGLVPVLCVGESLQERESGSTTKVIDTQLNGSLEGFTPTSGDRLVIAYEPVWAIGTGKTATPADAETVIKHIRERLSEKYGERIANSVRVLYGGSVKPDNVDELMAQPNIDGALVGGASLEAESFARIVNFQVHAK